MDFERMEDLKGQFISLECAFDYYKMNNERDTLNKLMPRLVMDFDIDDTIESDCVNFLNLHEEVLKRFNAEVQ
jgi:hypothetical protein